MADIGNQLEGVGEGLDRFLEALDGASYSLGSNAALQATQARAAKKIEDAAAKQLKKNLKLEKAEAKVLKDAMPFHKKLLSGLKDEIKNRTLLTKGMKDLSTSMTNFAKKALGGLGKALGGIAKAGVLGGMVAAVKLISDGLLRGDAAMAKLSARTGMTRKALAGVREEAGKAQVNMSQFGVTMEESLATAGNLVEAFGRADAATGKLMITSMKLQKGYGLSAEAAANLTKEMQLANRSAEEFATTVGVKATKAGMSASLIMRDLAANSQKISMYGERASDAYIELAVQAAKAGTSLKAFEGVEGAFADVDTIADNMGKINSKFPGLTKHLGTVSEQWLAIYQGGEEQVAQIDKMKKSLGDYFDVTEKGLVLAGTNTKVAAGAQREIATAYGFEVDALKKITALQDRNSRKAAGMATDKDREAEAAKTERERVATAMSNSMAALEKLSAIWTGLYATLTEQMDKIFGAGGMGKKIEDIGLALKNALNLKDFAADVEKEGGGWATAIGDRLSAVLKGVIANVFGIAPETVAGLGKAAAGIAAVMVGYKAVTKGMEVLGLKRNKDKLGMTRGNAMFVEDVGGISSMIPGGKKGGPAGMLAPLKKIFGKGGAFAKIFSFGGSGAGGIAKALLRRAPILGAGLAALDIIGGGVKKLQATTEEEVEIAEKQMASGAGGAAGALIGGAIGTAILPGIGTAIGAVLGGWLGGEAGIIIMENMDIIKEWFKGPIASFKAWLEPFKATWANIQLIASDVWEIAKSAFNIISHWAGELKGWFDEKVIKPISDFASMALTWIEKLTGWDISGAFRSGLEAMTAAFSWEGINKILKAIIPGYSVIAALPDVLADVSESAAGYFDAARKWVQGKEAEIVTEGAQGLSGYKGMAIVGEAGGEVITSASALRSGIGISGRAASALSGIGVPGYQEGTVGKRSSAVSETVATENLMDALGSQELKRAYAEAVSTEIGQQQAAMNDYWRRYYEIKMREAGARGAGGPGGPADAAAKGGKTTGDWIQYLFKNYPGLVDKSLQTGINKAFGPQGPVVGEMYKGVFSGMLAWSDGASSKEALRLGVMAGMGAALEQGGTINKFMTGIKEGNRDLLYAVQGGVTIEVDKMIELDKAATASQVKFDKADLALMAQIEKAMVKGDKKTTDLLIDEYELLTKQYNADQDRFEIDIQKQNEIIENLAKIQDKVGDNVTQAKLQYGATRGVTSAIDAALASFMAGGSGKDVKKAAIRGGVSQGAMGLGTAFFGKKKMGEARERLGSRKEIMSKYSIAGQRERGGGAFGIPGLDPKAMAQQKLGSMEQAAGAEGYGGGNIGVSKAAIEKAAAEKAAREKKALDDKAAAEKAAAEKKALDEEVAAAEKQAAEDSATAQREASEAQMRASAAIGNSAREAALEAIAAAEDLKKSAAAITKAALDKKAAAAKQASYGTGQTEERPGGLSLEELQDQFLALPKEGQQGEEGEALSNMMMNADTAARANAVATQEEIKAAAEKWGLAYVPPSNEPATGLDGGLDTMPDASGLVATAITPVATLFEDPANALTQSSVEQEVAATLLTDAGNKTMDAGVNLSDAGGQLTGAGGQLAGAGGQLTGAGMSLSQAAAALAAGPGGAGPGGGMMSPATIGDDLSAGPGGDMMGGAAIGGQMGGMSTGSMVGGAIAGGLLGGSPTASMLGGAIGGSLIGGKGLVIPGFAKGGVITSPTIAMLGEGGMAETVVSKPSPAAAPTPVAAAAPSPATAPTPTLGKDPLAGLAGPGEGAPEAPGEEGAAEGGAGEGLAGLGESVAGAGGGPAPAGGGGAGGPGGPGGAGGAGGGGIEAILMMILSTNQGISMAVAGVSGGIQGLTGVVMNQLTVVSAGIDMGFATLIEALTGMHAESTAMANAIGSLLGNIGTDLSGRMGTQIKHLSRIDTKVARHPSSIRHALKLTQGAAKGGGKEAGKEATKTELTSPPAPGHMPGKTTLNAAKGGAKGGGKGARKAWDKLERSAKGKYVNKPTVMMVGEEGRGEIVIPTERIRKGLPINAGVARELGSIGVPGFAEGGLTTRTGLAFGAGATTTFSNVFAGTGDPLQSISAGAGGGVENALVEAGVPPEFAEMGGMWVTKGLNKLFGKTGGYGKGRRRTLETIENHIKSRGMFDFGQPPGLEKWIMRAVGGKEKHPTDKKYKKLVRDLGRSKPFLTAGVSPGLMINLGSGQLVGHKAFEAYKAMNINLYGSAAGDKYMKAVALPQLADGGIVTRPTTAVVGEKGPEMIIPLHEQRDTNAEMIKELKKQNDLMNKMIKTQIETGGTTVRLDGRVIAESVGENFYEIGNGM